MKKWRFPHMHLYFYALNKDQVNSKRAKRDSSLLEQVGCLRRSSEKASE